EIMFLREQFKNVPMLLEVVDTLLELDQGTSLRKQKRAHHHTSEYALDGGKLWRVATGHHIRVHTHTQCVSPEEAVVLAREELMNNSHWQRDSVKKGCSTAFGAPDLMDPVWQVSKTVCSVRTLVPLTCTHF
ncbi:hypothetical protein K443DRAFT_87914, partial [Laccaria amethystina LaAM-08-1]